MRNESHHPTTSAVCAGSIPARSASAAFPGRRIRTGGAGGHQRIGVLPGPVPQAARGRSDQLYDVSRGAPASPSRPSRLPSHPITPARVAGLKEENR